MTLRSSVWDVGDSSLSALFPLRQQEAFVFFLVGKTIFRSPRKKSTIDRLPGLTFI